MLVNNIVFILMIGVCPFCALPKKMSQSLGMGFTVVGVMAVAGAVGYALNRYILMRNNLFYLQTMVFILVIVIIVQLIELLVEKFWPSAYESISSFLPSITTNCAVLAVCIMACNTLSNHNQASSFAKSTVVNIGCGFGYLLAVILMAGIKRKLEMTEIPRPFKGLPIALLSAGLVSMAFIGFSGFTFTTLFGG